jgi:Flp pilus assembly protein CpaB
VFAIALAIVAGLIFAWLFKLVVLNKPAIVKPPDDTVEITVAAGNIYDKTEVKPIQVKRVKVSKADYDRRSKAGRGAMLVGTQPVGRVTKVPIRAEEPFYDDDLWPFTYPESVEKRIRPGMRPVIVTVAAKEAMVQVDDYVDVYCSLTSDAFGSLGNGTAEIAKGAKVVARFGTTRLGAQPANPAAPREYTLEVTPYRYALIELAKTVGAKFSLAVVPPTTEGDRSVAPVGNDPNDPQEQRADHVDTNDLAAIFGVRPSPAGPGPWEVERYVGLQNGGRTSYPGYVPPSRAGGSTPPPPPPAPAPSLAAPAGNQSGQVPPPANGKPVSTVPAADAPRPSRLTTSGAARPVAFNPSNAVASTSRNFGLRKLNDRPYQDPSQCAG